MKYKALILDLDGTTIPNHPEGMPSERVAEAISRISKLINVSVATSRPLKMAEPILSHLKLSGPCVVSGATMIYDPVKKKILEQKLFDISQLPLIYQICLKEKAKMFVFNGEEDLDYSINTVYENILGVFIPELSPDTADILYEKFKQFKKIAAHKITAWTKDKIHIDITHPEATKLHGVAAIAKLLNISTSQIVGVGDSYNDFPLLMACGLKFAMGNAVPELKAIADFVAPSVDNDGVAVIIEKFLLPLLYAS